MYGHIDGSCIHVRPAFNLLDPQEEDRYHKLIDAVFKLSLQYGAYYGVSMVKATEVNMYHYFLVTPYLTNYV